MGRLHVRRARRIAIALVAAILVGVVPSVIAVPGSPDPAFGTSGLAAFPTPPDNEAYGMQLATTPSGAVWALIADQPTGYQGLPNLTRVVRIAPDGSVSGELSLHPYVAQPGSPFGRRGAIAADGESAYVVVNGADEDEGVASSLLRIRPDVTLDPVFGGDGDIATDAGDVQVPVANDCSWSCLEFLPAVARAGDGSVYTTVVSYRSSGPPSAWVAKLRPDGTADPGFGAGGLAAVDLSMRGTGEVVDKVSLRVDSSDRLLVANGRGVMRLLADGSLDASFSPEGIPGVAEVELPVGFDQGPYCGHEFDAGEICPLAVATDGTSYMVSYSRSSSGTRQDLVTISVDGSVDRREMCFDATSSDCRPATSLVLTEDGTTELHFTMASKFRTLALPPGPGDLMAQSVVTPVGMPWSVAAAKGPARTVFVSGWFPFYANSGVQTMKGGVTRVQLDVAPVPPSGTVSPPGGVVALGAPVTIEYSCTINPCMAAVVDGVVPDPVPPGWVPPSPVVVTIQSGQLLDTSAYGIKTVLVATMDGLSSTTIFLARATFYIGVPGPDTTGPSASATVSGAPPEATYVRTSDFRVVASCADEPGGSGVSTCDLFVVQGDQPAIPGGATPVIGPVALDAVGPWTVFVRGLDIAGNESTVSYHIDVLDGIEGDVPPDGTLGTDSTGGPPAIDMSAQLPAGGHVRIVRSASSGAPSGYELLANQFDLSISPQTAAEPAVLGFVVPDVILIGLAPADLVVFKDGVVVPDCDPGSLPAANPDPCVQSREALPLVGAAVHVRSSTGSIWTVGRALPAPTTPAAPADVQATAGPKKADVTWTVPSDGGAPISASTILAVPVPGSIDPATGTTATNRTKNITGDATSATIVLASGVTYDIKVRHRNAAVSSWSPFSTPPVQVTTPAVPDEPSGVTAVPGANRATVSWTAPVDASLVTGYTVTATATDGSGTVTKTFTTPVTSGDVTGLAPAKEYTFTVRANSPAGSSRESASSAPVTTFGLQGPPTDVSVTGANKTVTVSWNPPTSDAPITGYTVVVTPTGGGASVTRSAGATATSLSVAGLAVGAEYSVTVASRTAVGTSVPSAAATATTFGLPGVPSDVSVAAGVRRATVSWTAPASDSPLTGYTVVATPTGGGASMTRSASVSASPFSFTGLANDTEYSFTVAARSAVGVSTPSDPGVMVRTPALPAAPPNVTATAGASSAVVSWDDAMVDAAYPVTNYSVTVSATRPDSTVHTRTVSVRGLMGLPAATSVTVTSLEPGLTYSTSVKATTAVGTGAVSSGPTVSPFLGLSVADVSKVEGTGTGTQAVSFSVRLSSKTQTPVTFTAQTVDGTAVAPGDYTAVAPTSFTIAAGTNSKTVTVRVVRDGVAEPDESLQLVVSDIVGATATKNTATLTITNDD